MTPYLSRSATHPKRSQKRRTIVVLACLLVGLSTFANKPVPPPNPKDLAGGWFGLDEDRLTFCRLELGADGKGLCATTYVNHPALLYHVDAWSLQGFSFDTK